MPLASYNVTRCPPHMTMYKTTTTVAHPDGSVISSTTVSKYPGPATYALVAVDLDGTLLQWRTQEERNAERSATPGISEANTAALRRVSEVATVVIATGRGPASASRVADDVLALPCPLVCNNGACVLSAPDPAAGGRRTVLKASFYPREFVVGVAAVGGTANTLVCVYHPDPESPSGCAISYCGDVPADIALGLIQGEKDRGFRGLT